MGFIISKALLLFAINLSATSAFSATCDAQSAIDLKQKILSLSKANTSMTTNLPEVRAQLNELAFQLACKSQPVTVDTWVQHSPGSWRQIWSDEADNSPAGSPQRDLEKIFQIVIAEGRAVNFGVRILPNGQRLTFALEAKGTVVDNVQTTEILNGFVRSEDLKSGESLQALAEDIFSATFATFTPVQLGVFPKGPIGAKSDLTILYLDDQLKIGTAPNVYSGQSEMFVLERVNEVP